MSTIESSSAFVSLGLHMPEWVVVMGVAGCGKSTLAQGLATTLHVPFIEGDEFHPPENVRKMAEGVALDDESRQGWLDRLGKEMQNYPAGVVLSCSALKRVYRDCLRAAIPSLRFVHIELAQDLAVSRVASRSAEHSFPPSLVASQFAALENPQGEAHVLQLNGTLSPSELISRAFDWITAQSPFANTI